MRNTFKVLFYVNGSKEKSGVVPILGRVTVNGQAAQFSCKQTVALSLWDAKGKIIRFLLFSDFEVGCTGNKNACK